MVNKQINIFYITGKDALQKFIVSTQNTTNILILSKMGKSRRKTYKLGMNGHRLIIKLAPKASKYANKFIFVFNYTITE